MYAFGRKGRLSFDPQHVQDLGWIPDDWKFRFNAYHVKYVMDTTQNAPKQRSHPMQLRCASVNEVQETENITRPSNAVGYIRNNGILFWIKC